MKHGKPFNKLLIEGMLPVNLSLVEVLISRSGWFMSNCIESDLMIFVLNSVVLLKIHVSFKLVFY